MKIFTCALMLCGAVLGETPGAPIPQLNQYNLTPAPPVTGPFLKKADKLAICGDSITEQKMYSVILETYLTACHPELEITCRQYGWSGEQADGFLRRMDQDVLRFHPTAATICYGMNDHGYVPYTDDIGANYRKNQTAVIDKFQHGGVRVVLGSPGTIASVPHWVKQAKGAWEDLNLSLNKLRNIDVEIAEAKHTGFADVFSVMLNGMGPSVEKFGPSFHLSGSDGVHPDWAGHVFMAYAFLEGMGLGSDLGSVTVDLAGNHAEAAHGHEVKKFTNGMVTLTSHRYPFSWPKGDETKQSSIAAGVKMLPFQEKLNQFTLRVTGATAAAYRVTWGDVSRDFSREELEKGVNLADFEGHPLRAPFEKVWEAVVKKQAYETYQIKKAFRSPEARKDLEKIVADTEKERAPLAQALIDAMKPVDSELKIERRP